MNLHAPQEYRLPPPRASITGAFKDAEGRPVTVQLLPDCDMNYRLILPLRWVLPGVGRRMEGRNRVSLGYTYHTVSSDELVDMGLRRGFRVTFQN